MQIKKLISLFALLLTVVLMLTLASCKKNNCEHDFSSWSTIKEPTCGVEGEEESICSLCKEKSTRPVAPTGDHTPGNEWLTVKEPAYAKRGEKETLCTVCSSTVKGSIPALCETTSVIESEAVTEIDLSNCIIVHNITAKDSPAEDKAEKLAAAIKEKAGANIEVIKRSDATSGSTAFEILVGETKHRESASVLAEIEGEGFAVKVVGNKLVIIGTNEFQTSNALQYFMNKYLWDATEAKIEVCNDATMYNTVINTISDTSGTKYQLVYDKNLDDNVMHAYYDNQSGDWALDYPVQMAKGLSSTLAAIFRLGSSTMTYRNDETPTEYEIHVGYTDDPVSQSFLASLDGNEYGILVTENKVILTAHNDYALDLCVTRFKELLNSARTLTENKQPIYKIPTGFYIIENANEEWIVDFPRPDGKDIYLHSSISASNNALQFLYMGEGATADAFNTYCDQLVSAGYTVLFENEIEKSLFKTFVNDEMMLYVAYNAYAHADEEHNRDDKTHEAKFPYIDYEASIRVVSSPLDTAYIPDASLFSPQSYEKITESAITAVRLPDGTVGMGYIITLEDGSFIVIDGGYSVADVEMWNALKALHKNIYNAEPSAASPVKVKAWFVTHAHNDHYESFEKLISDHLSVGDLSVEYLVGNFPEPSAGYNSSSDVMYISPNMNHYTDDLKLKYVKVYTGYTLHFANVEMEMLMTFLDHAPTRINNANETCTIPKIYFNDTTTGEAKTEWLLLGDACVNQGRYICAMYGDYLQSEMVQLAHHGSVGCERAIYKLAAPTVVWYPHNSNGFNKYHTPNNNVYPNNVTNYIMSSLDSVKYVYVSGINNLTSTSALSLDINSDGTLNYDVYNPITGEKYTYQTSGVRLKNTPAYKLK